MTLRSSNRSVNYSRYPLRASSHFPNLSHTTRYLPVTSCGVEPFVLRLNVDLAGSGRPKRLDIKGHEFWW